MGSTGSIPRCPNWSRTPFSTCHWTECLARQGLLPLPLTASTDHDAAMADRVLVAYTSKIAATDEIAEIIGTELAGCGLRVTVLSVAAADTLHGFGAVIMGDAATRD